MIIYENHVNVTIKKLSRAQAADVNKRVNNSAGYSHWRHDSHWELLVLH
jgi:hypothetical protein